MSDERKRKAVAVDGLHQPDGKLAKRSKKWTVPRKGPPQGMASTIGPGDAGIWVTCVKGKESKAIADMRELLAEYLDAPSEEQGSSGDEEKGSGEDAGASDIEASIGNELRSIKQRRRAGGLFEPVKVDMACVIFYRLKPPLEPTALVHRICDDAQQRRRPQRSRFIQRLTPVTAVGKATEDGVDEVARAVLQPCFHAPGQEPLKFAVRPTIRHHSLLDRENIIRRVAQAIGRPHTVDLKHYDCLVLVDIWKNTCGMAVVGQDYEALKRYNLLEIYAAAAAAKQSDA